MKKKRTLIVIICVVCIAVILAVVLTRGSGSEVTPPDTAEVTRGNVVKTVSVDGNLVMPDKAYLSFGTTGTVTEVLVGKGSNVTEGQVLARLDAPSLESAVKMAELQVKIAEEQVRVAEIQVEIAEEGVDTLQALYEMAKEANNVTALIQAAANLNTAELNERMAESNLEVAELSLKSAKLSLDSAKLNLEKAVIAAPFDGVVADITIREGQEISTTALATPAITLVDTGRIEMRGLVDEVDVVMVKIGQAANITLDALPDEEIKGEVTFVSPVGTSLTGVVTYYQATITLEGPVAELKDGMSATAEVIVERRDDVLVVPNKAIRGSWANPWVEVYVDGQIVKREISLGLSDGRNTEVLSGLEEGEKVVLPAVEEWPSFFFM